MEETPQDSAPLEPGSEGPAEPEGMPEPPAAPAATMTAPPPSGAQQPPPKKSKKWWVIGCGCLFVVCIFAVLGIAIFAFGVKGCAGLLGQATVPIQSQLDALNNGDVEKAYGYMSESFRNESGSLERFKQFIESKPGIFKSKSTSFYSVNVKNDKATVKARITGQDGTVTNVEYTLVQEKGAWKISSINTG